MRYYHEFDTEKKFTIIPRIQTWQTWFLYRWRMVWRRWFDEDAYGPCLYDVKRDVFENCDGLEIRNENYKENQEVEEPLEYRVKRLEKKVKELEALLG